MSTETIKKFQPNRTLYLRGFDGAGAAAALCQTTANSFSVCGVYRDMADFCVLVIYDADNSFEHYSVRYLPDFNLSGMVLTFDVAYQGLQCLDSAKYSWIDWAQLDVITSTGATKPQIMLWDHATLISGDYTTAQGTFTITTGANGCTVYDRLTLFINNTSFDFVANGGEKADDVTKALRDDINKYNWISFANSSVIVMASTQPGGLLTIKYARTGYVNVSGVNVTWTPPADPRAPAGIKFPGLPSSSTIYISGQPYTIDAVTSPTTLTLTTAAPSQTEVIYLAEYGGNDGNGLTVYMVPRTPNINLTVDNPVLPLTGGNSDNVTWNISIDFSALGIDQLRQAWFTFAPKLPATTAYQVTEWTATFTNWNISDPNNLATLQIAGPNSLRVGNAESACAYSNTGWNVQSANNYWRGFSRVTKALGSSVTVNYESSQAHDLYLGTSLYIDRGIVSVTVDNDPATTLDCYLNVASEVVTRRQLRLSLPAGRHVVVITLTAKNPVNQGQNFIFDYLEATVPTPGIADAVITYPNVSPALDYDTDATYKMSPQRLLWHLAKLGFQGHMNEYLGVFWWNQRVSAGAVWNAVEVTVGGTWADQDYAELNIGGFVIRKSIITWDTLNAIADHFVYYINSATVAVWAEITATGNSKTAAFTIHIRTPVWSETVSIQKVSSTKKGTMTLSSPNGVGGTPGIWQVDPTAANPLNFAIRQWHANLFAELRAAGNLITTSFSMELVYPPDDGTIANAWQARYLNGTPVSTDTGFAHLVSSQCAFIPNMTAFQQKVYVAMAQLQSAAGLTPWLQFGEFLWWFFSSGAFIVAELSGTNPIVIETAQWLGDPAVFTIVPHGMSTGDRVVITGVTGCPAANGTWTITKQSDTQFSIPVLANGTWNNGSGTIRGGSMAYYDAVTSAAAQSQLGRDLFRFTCQDDDPTVNNSADTNFLAARLKAHVDAIRTAVLAQYPDAKFEILYPNDVNNPVCLVGPGVLYPQGGRMNAAVNLPSEWRTQPTSGLDSFKVEALSWSANYQDMNLAHEAIAFALTPPMSWNASQVAYLIPWFNGTCPWPRELLRATTRGLNIVNFWAYDHLSLMSWPIPLNVSQERSRFQG